MSSVVLRRMLYDPSSESLGPAVRSRSALALAVTIQVLEAGTDSMSMCWLLNFGCELFPPRSPSM